MFLSLYQQGLCCTSTSIITYQNKPVLLNSFISDDTFSDLTFFEVCPNEWFFLGPEEMCNTYSHNTKKLKRNLPSIFSDKICPTGHKWNCLVLSGSNEPSFPKICTAKFYVSDVSYLDQKYIHCI